MPSDGVAPHPGHWRPEARCSFLDFTWGDAMLQVIVLVLALFLSLACAQARIALRIGNRACDASVGVLQNP